MIQYPSSETRTVAMQLAKFLRSSADLVHRAADSNVMELVNLEEISLTVDEFIEKLTADENNDDAYVSADEDMDAEVFYDDEYVHDDEDS